MFSDGPPQSLMLSAVGGVALVLLGAAACAHWYTARSKKRELGIVSKLIIYPIKSCKGIEVPQATCQGHGLVSGKLKDRQYMVADAKTGEFITGRTKHELVLVTPSLDSSTSELCVNAPDMKELRLPLDGPPVSQPMVQGNVFKSKVEGRDCGADAAEWFSHYLSADVKLLYFDTSVFERRVQQPHGNPYTRQSRPNEQNAVTFFADGYPFLLCTESSVEQVNQDLTTDATITWQNFRPNILVSDTERPFIEDEWRAIDVGGLKLFCEKPCGRCVFPNVNPSTGVVNSKAEPFNTLYKTHLLKNYNKSSPIFGMNLILDGSNGIIKVGDVILQ